MPPSFITTRRYPLLVWSVFLIFWLILRERLMHTRGTVIWIEIFFLSVLYAYVVLSAYGLGRLCLRFLSLSQSKTETRLLSLLIGLGLLSVGLMGIGLLGWLNTAGIVVWMLIAGGLAAWECSHFTYEYYEPRDADGSPGPEGRFEVLLRILMLLSIPLQLVSVASPVWDYDALLYHLEVPRQFLAEGRIFFNPETWRSAYPYLGEMPFVIGMLFSLDSLAKLLNLTYAALFIGSVYTFSLRFLGKQTALTAVAILLGAPAFLLWSTWAAVDFAWASYEFWGVYAVLLWLSGDKPVNSRWLIIAGAMSGLAASIKYLSLPTLIILSGLVAWKALADRRQSAQESMTNLLIFGASAGIVMGTWYFKNWLWTGNPIYPLLWGGPGWDPIESQVLNDYVQTFGVGKTLLDYLFIPVNVYRYQDRFATIPLEVIHPALWLSFLVPFVTRSSRTLKFIVVYGALYFLVWTTTSQVIRFLIPLSGFASILAAHVIEKTPPLLKNSLKFGLLGGLMILALIYQIGTIQRTGAVGYLTGERSAAQFLGGINNDFRTITYIRESLSRHARVQFLWDGRGYYCDARCIPDDEQSAAIRLSVGEPHPAALAQRLRDAGITHMMLSSSDASWFIAYHDPHGLHQRALEYFSQTFLPACGKSLFQDSGMELFEITCS